MHANLLQKMEKADRQKKLESKKRRPENDGANPNSPLHRSKRRPIIYETVIVDSDDEESSPEDGSILYSGEREPLRAPNKISSPDTGRSPKKRHQTPTLLLKLPYKPIQPATGLPAKPPCPNPPPPAATESENRQHTPTPLTTIPIQSTQLPAGLPPKPPCPVPPLPVVTESENRSRLTEDALTTLRSRNVSDADNADSAPMSESDATEPVNTSPRNVPSDTSRITQIHQAALTPMATENPLLNEPRRAAEPTPSSAASPTTAKLIPLSRDKLVPPAGNGNRSASPASVMNHISLDERSTSPPVTCSAVSKLNSVRPNQTHTSMPPSSDYKMPWPLPKESTQESKIAEVCQGLSDILRSGVIDCKRRNANEKAAATEQRNIQQQIDDLKDKVGIQSEQIGRLWKLNEEKDHKIAALEEFRDRLLVVINTPYTRRSTEKAKAAE
ncbi:hypothetical protein BJX62DRAFT_151462 [Aspergillus germanicus]